MKSKKSLWAVAAVIACIAIAVLFSGSIQGGQNTYELQPNISVPAYKSDTVRAIEAYERLMDRYMDLTGSHLTTVGTDLRNIVTKLDSIDSRLKEMETRTARIERALGAGKESDMLEKGPRRNAAPSDTAR